MTKKKDNPKMTKLNPTKTLELAKAATPGPWDIDLMRRADGTVDVWDVFSDAAQETIIETDIGNYPPKLPDATLICHARNEIEHYASWVQRALPYLYNYLYQNKPQLMDFEVFQLEKELIDLINEVEK